MKAMILAAGLGSRLKPWTEHHPKALVPVGGVAMLERVIMKLEEQGFHDILVNVHHFSEQVVRFLREKSFRSVSGISDESGRLLDTGGALVHALEFFKDSRGVLIHNVDILSNADLRQLVAAHAQLGCGSLLLVSDRRSSRKLFFDSQMNLRGWQNLETGRSRPEGFIADRDYRSYAFSGIHVVGPEAVGEMYELNGDEPFPVMDYYLSLSRMIPVKGYMAPNLKLLDIGKPESLSRANEMLSELEI